MNKLIYFIGILCFSFNGICQSIITNGDFETGSPCPAFFGGTGYYILTTGWNNAANTAFLGSTADVVCSAGNTFAPSPPFSPLSGSTTLGFLGIPGANTEAATTNLTSTANTGDTIKLTLSVYSGSVLANGVDHPSLVFGIYFYNTGNVPEAGSGTILTNPTNPQHLTATPQIIIPSSSVVNDSWTTYSFSYIATSTISKMAIGFFRPGSAAAVNGTGGYYIIDGISTTLAPLNPCAPCTASGSGSTWTWTGCKDTDWFDPCNWDRLSVPNTSSNVIVPNTANKPVISGGTANCLDITVETSLGARVDLNSSGGGRINVVKP